MDDLPFWAQALAASLLLGAAVFSLAGAIGLVRLPDFYMRLHAPTKASTLGVGGVLLASIVVHTAGGGFAWRELLITLFVFVTAPVSANLMAQAALHLRAASRAAGGPAPSTPDTPPPGERPSSP